MDKQKQIEEMVLAVCPWLKEVPIEEREQLKETVSGFMVVERLYNAGYRKIHENAVVLTEEELFARDKKIRKADEEYIKALEECVNNRNAKARKETAEMFAERLKESGEIKAIALVRNGNLESIHKAIVDKIDEICKEITEEGVQNGN